MGTGVDESADTTVDLPDSKNRLFANVAGIVIAMIFDLAFVAQIHPSPFKNFRQLVLKNSIVSINTPVHTEPCWIRALED